MLRAAQYVLDQYGLPGAGLIFLLEGVGTPLPVEVPLWIIGSKMAVGHASYWQMVLLMWLSTVAGNTLGYLVGYYGGRPAAMKLLSWFRVKNETWTKMETWFQRHGLKLVVATRWANWGFAQNMWLCGITRVPFSRFFTVMVINDFCWAMAWTWLAKAALQYFRRHSVRFLHASTMKVGVAALVVFLLAFLTWWLFRKRTGPAADPASTRAPVTPPQSETHGP
jgi:membrane protein DedA with SNARE-associated domain